jgi:hypothetical protein
MGKQLYNYSVFDTVTDKYLIQNANVEAIHDVLDIQGDRLVQYATTGYMYDRRYHITRRLNGMPETEPIDSDCEEQYTHMPSSFEFEWDRARFMINPTAKDAVK